MQLVYSASRKAVRMNEPVRVAGKGDIGFEVKEIKKPNSKKPQGEVAVAVPRGKYVYVAPRDIGAEWVA